jgi:hypothetical protein
MANNSDESKTYLTNHHKLVIAEMIRDRKQIIKGIGTGINIRQQQTRAWQEIFNKVTELGGVLPNLNHLRKVSKSNINLKKFICRMLFVITKTKFDCTKQLQYILAYKSRNF